MISTISKKKIANWAIYVPEKYLLRPNVGSLGVLQFKHRRFKNASREKK